MSDGHSNSGRGVAHAYGDKAEWVFRNLPELKRKLILTHDKGLIGCENDILIDDRPHKANCRQFRGKLIVFTSWEAVKKELQDGSGAPAGTARELNDEQEAHEQIGKILLPLVGTADGSTVSAAQRAAVEIKNLRAELAQLRQERDADRLAEQIYALAEKVVIREEPLHFVRKVPLPSQIAAVIRGEVKDGKR